MIPPDLGTYTVEDKFKCANGSKWTDDMRRRDVKGSFGAGVPTQRYTQGGDNFAKIASLETRPMEHLRTEQGPVALPYGPIPNGWMPSIADLQAAPYLDSRRTAISDRYYR